MWYEPNKRFVKWFQLKNIDPIEKRSKVILYYPIDGSFYQNGQRKVKISVYKLKEKWFI